VRIADDRSGLPQAVRASLFRTQPSSTGGSGLEALGPALTLEARRYVTTARWPRDLTSNDEKKAHPAPGSG